MTAQSDAWMQKYLDSRKGEYGTYMADKVAQNEVFNQEIANPKRYPETENIKREQARLGLGAQENPQVTAEDGIPIDSPEAKKLLAESNAQRQGALSRVSAVQPMAGADAGLVQSPGPLSTVATKAERPEHDIAAMLAKFVPEDDSSSKYLAMAAALGRPTGFGSFGEKMANVADALMEQKQNQQKLRAQYTPLIMQQVAAQQAREEQAAYRMEAANQARAAQTQAALVAQQARQAQADQAQQAAKERADADRASREFVVSERIAADKSKRDEQRSLDTQSAANPEPILGVPVPRVLPWANQSNQKNADKVRMAEIAKGAKEIESDADVAKKNQALAQEAARFMELNAKHGTGGLSDRVPGGQWAQSFGNDYNEMQAITARLTPAMREAGAGATSDFDAKMFQRGTVGVDKPKATNDNIANALVQRAKLAKDYADFRSTYLEQNGTLLGANEHWNKYVNENPIFDPKNQNAMSVNQSRVGWRDYFGKAAPKASEQPRPANSTAPQAAPAAPKTMSWGDLK